MGTNSLQVGRARREFIALRHHEQQHARRSSMSDAEKNHEFDDAESMGGYSIEAGGRIQPTSLHQQQHTTRRSNMSQKINKSSHISEEYFLRCLPLAWK